MDERIKKMLSNPTLLVIDLQNVYSKGQKWECKNFDEVIKNIKLLLSNLKNNKVVFTRFKANQKPKGVWENYNMQNADVNSDKWLNNIADGVKQFSEKYPCYDKSVYSAYSIKSIREIAAESSCVVITGAVAECCVLSTVMSFIDAGVYVVYLKDAIASIDDKVKSATLNVLDGFAPLQINIMDTKEISDFMS